MAFRGLDELGVLMGLSAPIGMQECATVGGWSTGEIILASNFNITLDSIGGDDTISTSDSAIYTANITYNGYAWDGWANTSAYWVWSINHSGQIVSNTKDWTGADPKITLNTSATKTGAVTLGFNVAGLLEDFQGTMTSITKVIEVTLF